VRKLIHNSELAASRSHTSATCRVTSRHWAKCRYRYYPQSPGLESAICVGRGSMVKTRRTGREAITNPPHNIQGPDHQCYAASTTKGAGARSPVASAHLLKDLAPGKASSMVAGLSYQRWPNTAVGRVAQMRGRLYFLAENGLWRTDGTKAGTRLVRRQPGLSPSNGYLTRAKDRLFFAAEKGVRKGQGLFVSDGTHAGTRLIRPMTASGLVAVPGRHEVAFTHGRRVWLSDGTESGTRPATNELAHAPRALTPLDGKIAFLDGGLHVTAGEPTSTRLLLSARVFAGFHPIARLHGDIYFWARESNNVLSLWRSDGSPSGTHRLVVPQDHGFEPVGITLFRAGGELFFTANDADGPQLWRTNGTPTGTRAVTDAVHERVNFMAGTRAATIGRFQGEVLFYGNDGVHGFEPWLSDGTKEGTRILADVNPGPAGSAPRTSEQRPALTAGGDVFFPAIDGTHATDKGGPELFASDGTTAGTGIVRDIHPGPAGSRPWPLGRFHGRLLFAASGGGHGFEPWIAVPRG
jgi:ELWxxDGT repeat protein